jgi:hypothetical protein
MKTYNNEAGSGERVDSLAGHLEIMLTNPEAINEEHFSMVTADMMLSKHPKI